MTNSSDPSTTDAADAPKMDQVKSFLAGGAAGISAVLVGVSNAMLPND